MRKKGLKIKSCMFNLSVIVFLLLILNTNVSSGIDVLETNRGININLVSDENAYIGIFQEKTYSIDKGREITFYIKNNLPYYTNYSVTIDGEPIINCKPKKFGLYTNSKESIEIKIKNNAALGIHDINGYIDAEFNGGISRAYINFKIEVTEPIEEIEARNAVSAYEKAKYKSVEDLEALENLEQSAVEAANKVQDEDVRNALMDRIIRQEEAIAKKLLDEKVEKDKAEEDKDKDKDKNECEDKLIESL